MVSSAISTIITGAIVVSASLIIALILYCLIVRNHSEPEEASEQDLTEGEQVRKVEIPFDKRSHRV